MKVNKDEKILVTGGAGFIGSHTVKLLLKMGRKVIVLDNFSTGKIDNLPMKHPDLEVILGDVTDYATVFEQTKRCNVILHLAALPYVKKTIEDPISSLKINILGFVNVLQAIRSIDQSIRLVYASSAAVYGDVSSSYCDDNLPLPINNFLSPYALEKANNEYYSSLYKNLFGINSLGLRYFNVYGQGQDPKSSYSGVISKFIHQIEKKDPITIYGDGQQSRDFIHVSDVAYANFLACSHDYSGVINIGTGIPTKINRLAEYIKISTDEETAIKYESNRLGDIKNSCAKIDKAEKTIGFFAKFNLEESLSSLVKY